MVIPVLHMVLVVAAASLVGVGRPALVAALTGVPAPPPFWRDLRRLWRKTDLRTGPAALAPPLILALDLAAVLLVPTLGLDPAGVAPSDLLVVFALLAAARLVRGLAAIEAAGARGGTQAARMAATWAAAGPALVLIPLIVAGLTGTANLDSALAVLRESDAFPVHLPLILAAAGVALIGFADLAGPEGDTAGFGGPSLAMLRVAGLARTLAWLDLTACLLPPVGPAGVSVASTSGAVLIWAAKVALLAAGLAVREARRPRPTRHDLPLGPALAGLLGLLGMLLLAMRQSLT